MKHDQRFDTPLYTLAEAARVLDVPPTTFQTWVEGVHQPSGPDVQGEPMVTDVGAAPGTATIPFIGLAERFVLAAVRKQGVPLQRIRPAIKVLRAELGARAGIPQWSRGDPLRLRLSNW